MPSAIFDFKAIARVLRREAAEVPDYCLRCSNSGWEGFWVGPNAKCFGECTDCGNPSNHPCP